MIGITCTIVRRRRITGVDDELSHFGTQERYSICSASREQDADAVGGVVQVRGGIRVDVDGRGGGKIGGNRREARVDEVGGAVDGIDVIPGAGPSNAHHRRHASISATSNESDLATNFYRFGLDNWEERRIQFPRKGLCYRCRKETAAFGGDETGAASTFEPKRP